VLIEVQVFGALVFESELDFNFTNSKLDSRYSPQRHVCWNFDLRVSVWCSFQCLWLSIRFVHKWANGCIQWGSSCWHWCF